MNERPPIPAPEADEAPRPVKARLLLVDDETRFRESLAERLALRGYQVQDVGDGEEAIRVVRQTRPDVVILDRKMPGLEGEEVLRELKKVAPEVQVIVLTGYASIESASEAGRLDAYAYLEKPCETEELIATIEAARREKVHAMARQEIPVIAGRSLRARLWGTNGSRPGVMMLAALLFALITLSPPPETLVRLLDAPKTEQSSDPSLGYAYYRKLQSGESIAEFYSHYARREVRETTPEGKVQRRSFNAREASRAAQVMMAILVVAALFWATGALPIGITALLVGVLMYLFQVFPPDLVASSYAKDAVVFIMGVLALAAGIGKTGLDRRIGLLLLGTSRSLPRFLFLFLPLLGMTAAFLSEHALVAFIAPILMVVYTAAVRAAGVRRDRALAVLLILSLCFAANQGGPGSPAAGGRNAVMVGILADYGIAPTFGQWVKYGMPFVPVMALVIAGYFYLRFRGRLTVKDVDVAALVRREVEKIGPWTRDERLTAVVLALVVALWITASGRLGMGGPALLGIVLLAIMRVVAWRDINRISWDVVALYGSATAMGAGLAYTGASLWMASSFLNVLPEIFAQGTGLAIACSFFAGLCTQFMSDGATVSALGPIAVPMAQLSGTHPWMVGLAAAFASSFANTLLSGTPNNAIAYSLAKDLDTGEQLVTIGDFLKHGAIVTLLAFAVLWGWLFLVYWRWIGFSGP